jgi:hypothetical protein
MMTIKVRMAAKSIFGLVIMNENKAMERARKVTRRMTRVRKSRKFKRDR